MAALDVGTNNCRLLVAVPEDDGYRVIDAFSRVIRLGEGVAASGRLAPAAISRAVSALRVCAGKMARWQVGPARMVATEACRRADNCDEFHEAVWRNTGLTLEIIDAKEEARLAVRGCMPLKDRAHSRMLVFDIGGGSTEVSWVLAENGGEPRIIDHCSLNLGVVCLTEKYGNCEGVARSFDEIVGDIAGRLAGFADSHDIGPALDQQAVQLIGTSGTVTTLTGIQLGLDRYDRTRVDGAVIHVDDALAIGRRLASQGPERRAQNPCVGKERADLVVAGCAILEGICRSFPTARLTVADRGLREGILLDLLDRIDFAGTA